jgi:signal transduction histidine kinase
MGLSKDLAQELWPVFAPIFGSFSKVVNVGFIILIMTLCLFTPLLGPPRTLAQLSHDGLVPQFFGKMTKAGIPRNATIVTSVIAIGILWLGTPLWIIAATSFQYLLCISMASIAVWLLRRRAPELNRVFRAPTVFIYLGVFSAMVWMTATILGFQQYGLTTMIIGIVFAFIGTPLYIWRKVTDRMAAKLPPLPSSLHVKLTGTMLAVLAFDVLGYLIAVNSLKDTDPHLNMLEDIFVVVALIAITVGLALPGMIVHAAEEVNRATKRLIKTNLFELSQAMEELGAGSLKQKQIKSDIIPIEIHSRDEIGEMAFSFNEMQGEIQKTANSFNDIRQRLYSTLKELKTLNETLEKRVEERTQELDTSNKKLQNEIVERIRMEKKVKTIHNQLVVAARHAGMADIAKSTLHNIGNILNSINTSVTMLNQNLKSSQVDSLMELAKMLKTHSKNMAEFITNDEKGKLVPSYLCALSEDWQRDKKNLFDELNSLQNNIDHVRNIISMQQTLSEAVGIAEEVSIDEIVNDAISLKRDENKNVTMGKNIHQTKTIITDRVKLLQIIVNLISNAIDALQVSQVTEKKISVSFTEEPDYYKIIIKDNGIGISSENLKKIFSYGFTTKEAGHGLGLHSSSLEVKELGGTLQVESEGEGLGATFTITLPYVSKKEKLALQEEV